MAGSGGLSSSAGIELVAGPGPGAHCGQPAPGQLPGRHGRAGQRPAAHRHCRHRGRHPEHARRAAREYLAAHAREQTPAITLEKITGTDRFTLTRHFQGAFGTSPDRYRIRRRLDVARAAIERWVPLAQAAIDAGLADQRPLTRQFKQAYCLTPAAGRTPSDSPPCRARTPPCPRPTRSTGWLPRPRASGRLR